MWFHLFSQIDDMLLGQLPDRYLCHFDSILEFLFSQLDFKILVIIGICISCAIKVGQALVSST
jgi:hypothetical protein